MELSEPIVSNRVREVDTDDCVSVLVICMVHGWAVCGHSAPPELYGTLRSDLVDGVSASGPPELPLDRRVKLLPPRAALNPCLPPKPIGCIDSADVANSVGAKCLYVTPLASSDEE